MNTIHEPFIRQAIALARQARDNGNHPFGALLVHNGTVLLTAQNTVNTGHDVTHHAELNLVSQASRRFSSAQLAQSRLYTSTEPCAMCAGAIFWTGIRVVVYGCAALTLAEITGGGSLLIPCRQIFQHGVAPTQVIGPILEAEARQVHEGFWSDS